MHAEDRRHRALEIIRMSGGFASLPQLATELGVSESTIRRDLDVLEESGVARRTHGGVFYVGGGPQLPVFELREPEQWAKKRAIAQTAAQLIKNGDTVLFDGGSTTYELARLLVGRPLQVVTNSLPVANLFAANAYADLNLIGGFVYPRTGVALGPHAVEMISQLNVRCSVLSVAGITERGFYNSNLFLTEAEKAMIHAADQVIVVADSTKFGRQSLSMLCDWSAVHTIVVDDGLSREWQERIRQLETNLILATPDQPSTAATSAVNQ